MTRRLFLIFFLSITVVLTGAAVQHEPVEAHRANMDQSTGFSKTELYLAMPDHVKLATDLYLPEGPGKFPAIIVRTPYGKDGAAREAEAFAARGVAVIVQDCRGKYKSEGRFYAFRDERPDGLATLKWIRDQQWSNGKVGGFGASYLGFTQWAIADELAVFSPDLTTGNIYDLLYPDGLFSLKTAFNWGLSVVSKKTDPPPAEKLEASVSILPLSEADDATVVDIPYINDWLTHEQPDRYWQTMNHRSTKKAPAISTAGWYDYFLKGQIADFQVLSETSESDYRMIIGPWPHEPQGDDVKYGGRAKTGNRAEAIRDYMIGHLKDGKKSVLPPPFKDRRYNLFIMGRNEYFGSDVWPPRETQTIPYYIGPGHYLGRDAPTATGALSYRYDPADPYPSLGGPGGSGEKGAVEQNANVGRSDQLVFETEALKEPLILLGPLSATLWLSSDVPCTDFIVCLQDEYPDGSIYNIQQGGATVRFDGRQPEKKELTLWATGYQLDEGHKLRVTITSSWFPRYNRNLNTCEPIFDATSMAIANQQVHYSPDMPSSINLPALPASHLGEWKNVRYGAAERNVLDLYLPDSNTPTPLVVFIHGGGFRRGSKDMLSKVLLETCLRQGIAVAAINYRLTDVGPFPLQHMDAARAIQFLRHHAAKWNLDKTKIAATGESAGAGIALWLGFHDDLADPRAEDPVLRESTRLSCMAVLGAQHTYDPHWIKKHVGGQAHLHPALALFYGVPVEKWNTRAAKEIFKRSAAITYLTRDDPPVWAIYNEPDSDVADDAEVGVGIHHPRFGRALQSAMQDVGITCIIKHADEYEPAENRKPYSWPEDGFMSEMVDFFRAHFQGVKH